MSGKRNAERAQFFGTAAGLASERWTRVLLATVGVIVLCQALVAAGPYDQLPDWPVSEDGYYALTVARHIALGQGMTIDGVQLTNGFQPLFTFVCVPLHWLAGGDRVAVLRWLYVLQALVVAIAAWLLFHVVSLIGCEVLSLRERRLLGATAALLYASAPVVIRAHFNGLETGWLMMMYMLGWLVYQRGSFETPLQCARFGALLGLLVLSRVDAVFFVVITAGCELFAGRPVIERCKRFAAIGGSALAVSGPWWGFNLLAFGSLMPISGSAQQSLGLSSEKLRAMVEAIALVATPTLLIDRVEGTKLVLFAVRVCAIALIGYFAALVVRRDVLGLDAGPQTRRTLIYARNLALTYAVLTLWYLVQSGARWFYPRYLAPAAILALVVLACTVVHGVRRNRGLVLAAVLASSLQIPFTVAAHHFAWVEADGRGYRRALELVLARVPADEFVASEQSGMLGYFRAHVVNCDGKVNPEVHAYRGRLQAYLDERRIDWWIDWGFLPHTNWNLVEQVGRWKLYRRPPRSSSLTPSVSASRSSSRQVAPPTVFHR
jgi:hypothetical protein